MSTATRQTSPQNSDALKSTAEVGNLLGVSPTRVNQLIHAKELRAVRIGRLWRVRPADLARFIEERATPGGAA